MTTSRTAISLDELLKLEPEEMLQHDETPAIEELRDRRQVFFEDVEVGMELPKYVRKQRMVDLMRWGITMENDDRLHYDYPYSMNGQRVPGVLFHGTWRMSILAAWLKNWALPDGWAWKARWQVREMVVPDEITIVWGKVVGKRVSDGIGLVDIEFGIRNQDGIEGCPGAATIALPQRDGPAIPYPFVPPSGESTALDRA